MKLATPALTSVLPMISAIILTVTVAPISNKQILKDTRAIGKTFHPKKDLSFVFKNRPPSIQKEEAEPKKVSIKKIFIKTSGVKNENDASIK